MAVPAGRVALLVAQERDRRELKELECNRLATEDVRAFVDRELARHPEMTRAELAQGLNMRPIDLDRQLGYKPGKDGKIQQQVRLETASRVVIALGRAPHELDGC